MIKLIVGSKETKDSRFSPVLQLNINGEVAELKTDKTFVDKEKAFSYAMALNLLFQGKKSDILTELRHE